jgi:hypothetical protein
MVNCVEELLRLFHAHEHLVYARRETTFTSRHLQRIKPCSCMRSPSLDPSVVRPTRAHVFLKNSHQEESYTGKSITARTEKSGIGIGAARSWARPLSCALKERYGETHLVYTLRTR